MKQKKERPRLRRLIFTLSLVVFVIQLINFLIFGGVLIFLAESGRLGEVNSFNRALPLLFAAVTSLPVGTLLRVGETLLQVTQIGKECHNDCEIRRLVGTCVMPTQGIFAIVLTEGTIRPGDTISVEESAT